MNSRSFRRFLIVNLFIAMAADELRVIPAGDEADLLAVFLIGHAHAKPLGPLANFPLLIFADGKHQPRQQLANAVELVAPTGDLRGQYR